jgi:arylsulfatase A-like enzyme
MDWGIFPERDEDQADAQIAGAAIAQLASAPADRPLFLAVGFRLPHVPNYASQRWFDQFPEASVRLPPLDARDRDDVPPFAWYLHWKLPEPRLDWMTQSRQLAPFVRAYLASTAYVDSEVGRLLAALDASPRGRNAIVVLWSDHGYHLGEKGIPGKNSLWERSTHVPLIFAGRGIDPGVSAAPVELLDIYPTLTDLAGLPPAEGLEGHSLAALLKDPRASRPWPAITTHNQGNHAVRTERWRYIRYADGSEELYDMIADPNEWTNLAGQSRHAATIAELRRWLPTVDSPPAPGSRFRILTRDGDGWSWEGERIRETRASSGDQRREP